MEHTKVILGNNEHEIWAQIEADIQSDPSVLQYQAEIQHLDKIILLDIDVDLGGGFEGGFELTTFTTPLSKHPGFRFALHHEDFLDEVGKFFGMQDLITGYEEFDKNVVVKTDDLERFKEIFSDPFIRLTLQNLSVFRFYIENDNSTQNLVLEIEEAITEPGLLRSLYSMFYRVLSAF